MLLKTKKPTILSGCKAIYFYVFFAQFYKNYGFLESKLNQIN